MTTTVSRFLLSLFCYDSYTASGNSLVATPELLLVGSTVCVSIPQAVIALLQHGADIALKWNGVIQCFNTASGNSLVATEKRTTSEMELMGFNTASGNSLVATYRESMHRRAS